jgi:hypothetical protein
VNVHMYGIGDLDRKHVVTIIRLTRRSKQSMNTTGALRHATDIIKAASQWLVLIVFINGQAVIKCWSSCAILTINLVPNAC